MKIIVGLGNPGTQYEKTRHNAGFMALERVVSRYARTSPLRQRFSGEVWEGSIGSEKVLALRPMRFMNCSGTSVVEALSFYKLSPASDLLVLVDDYSLPLGALRLRGEGGAGGHNGLADIERALGHTNYPRLRIGIDPAPPAYDDPADWVLGRFTDEQLKGIAPALDRAADAVGVFVIDGLATAMNRFNVRPKPPAPAATPSPVQAEAASGVSSVAQPAPVRSGGAGSSGVPSA